MVSGSKSSLTVLVSVNITALSRRAVQLVEAQCHKGSIPGRVVGNFQVTYSFCPHPVVLGSIQPLNRNEYHFLGAK
jgi:hypothetical protein